jgi:hypothetical protein
MGRLNVVDRSADVAARMPSCDRTGPSWNVNGMNGTTVVGGKNRRACRPHLARDVFDPIATSIRPSISAGV